MEVSCICLSSPPTFAGAPLKKWRLSSLPTHNNSLFSHLSITRPPLFLSSPPIPHSFPPSPPLPSFLPPANSTQPDLITDTTEALRAHLQKFRSTILEASTNNEERKAPCSDSESSSSTSSSESSESEEDESPEFLPKQRNKSIPTALEGCNPVTEREDGEISTVCRHFTSTERIEVCTGGKCRHKGSVAVFGEFRKQVGIGSELYVSASKCMGKCKHGPNVRISRGEGESTASVLSGVHLEKVDAIVGSFFGRKGITGAPTYVPPQAKQGNVPF